MNCWEFKMCPPQTYRKCPAYPDRGRECWKLDRTLCDAGKKEVDTLADKVSFCRSCDFYIKFIVGSLEKAPKPDAEPEVKAEDKSVEDGLEG